MRVLVVDDEQELADITADLLAFEFGYSTDVAYSCDEALSKLAKDPTFDLIVSDIKMPGKTGIDLLEAVLKDKNSGIPVIFVTGYTEFEPEELRAKGASQVLAKPLNVNQLVEVMGEVLQESKPKDQGNGSEDIHILVVEDDASVRELICTNLRSSGYQCLEGHDGKAAVEVLQANRVDLVLTDILMPRMNGCQLLQEMKRLGLNVPVIVFSGGDPGYLKQAMQTGAKACLEKPLHMGVLMETVQKTIGDVSEGQDAS